MSKKVNVYIDGFNLYYALKKKIDDPKSGRTSELKRCNYRKLFEDFLAEGETLNKVYYFTAYRVGNKASAKKHKTFVEALTKNNVMPILGKYQRKTNTYRKGRNTIENIIYSGEVDEKEKIKQLMELFAYKTYEEKETDVKLALQIVQDAFQGSFDHAIIVSGDSDITPAIQSIKALTKKGVLPPKVFSSILIPGTKGQKIRKLCDIEHEVTAKQLRDSLLPFEVQINDGRVICIPEDWISTQV